MRNAEKYLFSLGLNDPAEEVGRVNAILYLAKMHYIQEKLGYKPQPMFIGTPDFTFQTSPRKFHESVPEGGRPYGEMVRMILFRERWNLTFVAC